MGSTIFIVWRESVEAMLVIGILHSWLKFNEMGRAGLRALWLGVGAGVALAGALGWACAGAASQSANKRTEASPVPKPPADRKSGSEKYMDGFLIQGVNTPPLRCARQ